MISAKMEKMLNDQFNCEAYSASLYISMASYFTDKEMDGMSRYFMEQAKEELFHGNKIFSYLHDVGGKLEMESIKKPQTNFKSVLHAFEVSLSHEKGVTKSINELVKQAINESDYATQNFLGWFLTEQVEEEATIQNILKKLQMIGDNSGALYLLDNELGMRKFQSETDPN